MLRKTDVVNGALKFLDAEGLDSLTMRKLSASLNVQGGALYRHFPHKAALLDAMADRLLEGVGDPLPSVPWHEQIYILGDRFRTALLTHRDGARLVGGLDRTLAGPRPAGANTTTASSLVVAVLCGAGLSPTQAGWLAFALFYYVLGHTIEEQAQVNPPVGDNQRSPETPLAADPSSQYAAALASLRRSDPAERFAYGLNTFIEGIACQIPGPAGARSPMKSLLNGPDAPRADLRTAPSSAETPQSARGRRRHDVPHQEIAAGKNRPMRLANGRP